MSPQIWVVTFPQGPTIIGVCDDSGEDPTCHNSVCYLGLCTSIADHMEYLGAHMYHRRAARRLLATLRAVFQAFTCVG